MRNSVDLPNMPPKKKICMTCADKYDYKYVGYISSVDLKMKCDFCDKFKHVHTVRLFEKKSDNTM